jgi:hypothetical protein
MYRLANTNNMILKPMRYTMASSPRYHDHEDDPIETQQELNQHRKPAAHPKWYRYGPKTLWERYLLCCRSRTGAVGRARDRQTRAWVLIVVVVLTLLGVIAGLSAFSYLAYSYC